MFRIMLLALGLIFCATLRLTFSIFVPNSVQQSPRPYTTGIRTAHWKTANGPLYHQNYSKVYVHNKNYTSSLLNSSPSGTTKLYPVYNSDKNAEKLENVLEEHNSNIVEKDKLNDRVVYKRRIEKTKQIEVYNKCPKGVTGQFVYDLSCNQYLDCWKGRGGPRNCAPGTLFNPKTLECDFPDKVECITGPERTIVQRSARIQAPQQPGCPDGFSGLIPNYTDCSKFVQCNNGQQFDSDCPPGTLFDVTHNICNFPDYCVCFSNRPNLVQHSQSHTATTQPGGTRYNQHAGQQNYQNARPSESDGAAQHAYGASGGYNSGYGLATQPGIQANALRIVGASSDGQWVYYYPQNVGGNHPATGSIGSSQLKYVICDPNTEDCSPFYAANVVLIGNCDPQRQNCGTSATKTYGTLQASPQQICNPQYQNCRQFVGGQQQATFASQPCNPQLQNCPQNYQTSSPGQPTTNYNNICNINDKNCNQAASTAKLNPGGQYQGQRTTSTSNRQQGSRPKCPHGYQGITKHPTDCKKFLNCANGITYVQSCGPGTLFNPLHNNCDHPENVDCENGADVPTDHSYAGQNYNQYEQQPVGNVYPENPQQSANCQGYQCTGYTRQTQQTGNNQQGQGQWGGGQTYTYPGGQEGQTTYGQAQVPVQGSSGGGCQGIRCSPGGQSQPTYGQAQVPVQDLSGGGCQGNQCSPGGQGQITYGQAQVPVQGLSGRGCQGNQCNPGGQGQITYGQAQVPVQDLSGGGCQGNQCSPGGQSQPTYGQNQWATGQAQVPTQGCQGNQCSGGQTYQQHQFTGYDNYQTTVPPQTSGGNVYQQQPGQIPVYVQEVPSNNVQPINKHDRLTYGGFSDQKSSDYVDIFDPNESRNFAAKRPRPNSQDQQQVTDADADYVFEYEDGEPVTLAPEKVVVGKRKKSRCEKGDFKCTPKVCIAKTLVCDGVKDCDDGKDEKACNGYLNQFKVKKNSKLNVLEKQRWDNVSHVTCAFLCLQTDKFECKSFNYRKVDKACFLTAENLGETGALKSYYPCDYYERKTTALDCSDMHKCPNGKCLTSDQVCDGYNDCGDRADEKNCRPDDFGYEVSLAGSDESHEGRVEVRVFGKTGYICDDQFSLTDANVLCRELGFKLGAAEVKGNSFFAKDLRENNTLYMMDDIECVGNETSLMHCNFAGWGIHNCGDYEIAGVVCKTPQEKCGEGFWKCDTGNECVRIPFVCDGLYDCTDNSDEASHHCEASTEVRLVNGTTNKEGRLEIRHHGIWGTVCDDDFNEDAAKIVCKYLGFSGSALVKKDAYFGSGDGPIWLDQVSCFGNETSLELCTHWDWGEHNCDHTEDVGIVCGVFNEVELQRNSKAVKNNRPVTHSPAPVQCGFRKDNIFLEGSDVHFRVVQGSVAKPGEYPWQAALKVKGKDKTAHWCGAVVLSSKWVLTAAHCLEGYSKGAYVIVAGEYNTDEDEGTEQQAYIDEYYIHENFRKGHKMGNDIALIKLKGSGFRLNQDIQPICLPDEDVDYDTELNCTISGFGTIQTGKSAYSHNLRAAWVPIQKLDVCKMAHIYGEAIGDGMICAGDLNGGVDACDGDSGGPLACLDNGVFTLYGVTSWGQRCGYANKPGVYVKVSYYKRWIEDTMNRHS